jgi:predicted small secreted protein
MNVRFVWISLVLLAALLLSGCNPTVRVGEVQTESQVVEGDNAESVRTEITIGAGDLRLAGGAEKLMEADFTYNVAQLKPEVAYAGGKLTVRQPEIPGVPNLRNIDDFRNEWDLRLSGVTPIDMQINMGAGTSDLDLTGLPLNSLALELGAGTSTLDLSGDWAHDVSVTVDSGAANVSVRLPQDVGVRVEVNAGPTVVNAPGLSKNGNVYTNAAYGVSDVTLNVTMDAGVGLINLAVAE